MTAVTGCWRHGTAKPRSSGSRRQDGTPPGPGWRALSRRTLPRRRRSAARVRPGLRRPALRLRVLDHL